MGFTITLLLIFGFCYCSDKLVEVVGTGDCVDCTAMEVKGILVAIFCKDTNAKLKIRGVSELDEEGKFRVILPSESVNDDGQLKEECFAQLHKASSAPCSADNGLEALKVILKSKDGGKHTFTPSGKLTFSQTACTPAFLFLKFKLQALLFPPLSEVQEASSITNPKVHRFLHHCQNPKGHFHHQSPSSKGHFNLHFAAIASTTKRDIQKYVATNPTTPKAQNSNPKACTQILNPTNPANQ